MLYTFPWWVRAAPGPAALPSPGCSSLRLCSLQRCTSLQEPRCEWRRPNIRRYLYRAARTPSGHRTLRHTDTHTSGVEMSRGRSDSAAWTQAATHSSLIYMSYAYVTPPIHLHAHLTCIKHVPNCADFDANANDCLRKIWWKEFCSRVLFFFFLFITGP